MLAVWALQQDEAIRAAALPYAVYFCFGALAAAALISWYYDSMRLLGTSLVLIGASWALQSLPPEAIAGRACMYTLLAFDFLLFAWIHERGVTTIQGLSAMAFVFVQGAALIWVVPGQPWVASSRPWSEGVAMGALALAGVTLLISVVRRHTKVEHGLLWAFVAIALASRTGTASPAVLFYGGAAGLILMFAVLEHGHDIAYLDELTGLPGRRAFNQQLARLGKTYTFAMCDVDHFKRFNDTHGHDAGDQALRMVAAKLADVEGGGKAFRYGGEEFVVVFRGRTMRETQPYLERLRQIVADERFVLRAADRSVVKALTHKHAPQESTATTLTISIGLAERSGDHALAEAVLEAADKALYRAKALGRNRVIAAETPVEAAARS